MSPEPVMAAYATKGRPWIELIRCHRENPDCRKCEHPNDCSQPTSTPEDQQ